MKKVWRIQCDLGMEKDPLVQVFTCECYKNEGGKEHWVHSLVPLLVRLSILVRAGFDVPTLEKYDEAPEPVLNPGTT